MMNTRRDQILAVAFRQKSAFQVVPLRSEEAEWYLAHKKTPTP